VTKSPKAALVDMLDAVRRIEKYTKGLDAAAFRRDDLRRDAVERCIEIISEASRRLPRELKDRYSDIPWSEVATVGIIFRHEYDAVYPP